MTDNVFLHIAVGVIRNKRNQVLLSLRPSNVPQANLWEFPGGKLESGETTREALTRELKEELDLNVISARPLIKIHHNYGEYTVLLDVLAVDDWDSEFLDENAEYGREGQKVEWVEVSRLCERKFPEANKAIINAVKLPHLYLICPLPETDDEIYVNKFARCLSAGVSLFQLRFGPDILYEKHSLLISQLLHLCRNSHSKLILNSSLEFALEAGADGVHLNSKRLMQLKRRPMNDNFFMSASCHNMRELEYANKKQLDFVVVSPVKATSSHQNAKLLGWDRFAELVEAVEVPVYALGGMQADDIAISWTHGGQGVSVLSGIWNQKDIGNALNRYRSE